MDQQTKRVLVEVLDMLRSMVPSVQCGYHWCPAVRDRRTLTACEHINTCRGHYELEQRSLEIKEEVEAADPDTLNEDSLSMPVVAVPWDFDIEGGPS